MLIHLQNEILLSINMRNKFVVQVFDLIERLVDIGMIFMKECHFCLPSMVMCVALSLFHLVMFFLLSRDGCSVYNEVALLVITLDGNEHPS